MSWSTFHLLVLTLIFAAALLVPRFVDPTTRGVAVLFSAAVFALLVPYAWFATFAAATTVRLRRHKGPIAAGFPLHMLRRVNLVAFGLDATLLVVAAWYAAGTSPPRIALIVPVSLLVVVAFALPPAVFVARTQITRIGQDLAARLEELQRLRTELRFREGRTRRS